MGLIFALSSVEEPPTLPGRMADKGAHGALYFGLGTLLVRALAGGWSGIVTMTTAATAVGAATLYGISDEIHQWFVPGRQADLLDVIADAVGALLAAGLFVARSGDAEAKRRRGV